MLMKTDVPRPILLKDYTPPPYLIDTVGLDVMLHPTATRVMSRLKIRRNPAAAAHGPLLLDGEGLQLRQIKLDGHHLDGAAYQLFDGGLSVAAPPEEPFTLEITTFVNPEANKALQGLYRRKGIYCTQCEAQGFRRITYFLDRPDVLATYTVRIEADRSERRSCSPTATRSSAARSTAASGTTPSGSDPHPKPCYLFALVGGDLASIASDLHAPCRGARSISRIYVEPGKESARAPGRWTALKRSMRWDEQRFGREYDLDVFNIVAVSDFNMGAMENKGLNIFNDRLILASPETATDAHLRGDRERRSRTSTSTTGPATASPAATGSSSA